MKARDYFKSGEAYVWLNAGTVYKGKGQITTGDVNANASGAYSLTTACKLTLSDS